MKNLIILFFALFPQVLFSQNQITIKFVNNNWTTDQDKLNSANVNSETHFTVEGCGETVAMEVKYSDGNNQNLEKRGDIFVLSELESAEIAKNPEILIKCGEISKTFKIFANSTSETGNTDNGISAEEYFKINNDTKNIFNNNIRYSGDNAYIFLDEYGKYIGKLPVNLDEDDVIYLFMAVNKSEKDKYEIEVTQGEYSPVDLQITPGETITAHGGLQQNQWGLVKMVFGPYTSDYFAFTIKKKKGENLVTLSSYKIKINNLYHLQIGASFVATFLRKPEYKLFPLTDSTNTIIDVSNKSRTLITVNVIWYWEPILKYFFGGSKLIRGRDILKEPTFWQRINPTFGVSLSENIAENYFIGLTLEFARGGSIIGGGHFGKTTILADKKFEQGKTQFNGQLDDIITEDKYEWKYFIGITLDTRVFNKLFVGGGS